MHVFKCIAKSCKGKGRNGRLVNRYLDTGDRKSTGNLWKHAKLCFGEDTLRDADATRDVTKTREILAKNPDNLRDGSLSAVFATHAKGKKVTYSHRQHTKTEIKSVLTSYALINILISLKEQRSCAGFQRVCGPLTSSLIVDSTR